MLSVSLVFAIEYLCRSSGSQVWCDFNSDLITGTRKGGYDGVFRHSVSLHASVGLF